MLLALLLAAHAETAMVGFEAPTDATAMRTRLEGAGGKVRRCYTRARLCVVDFDGAAPIPVISRWEGVRYAERDRPMDAAQMATPDALGTEDCDAQWELETIHAFDAWAIADGTWAPVVAVEDSGFVTTHIELEGRISGRYDYGNGDTDPEVEWDSGVPAHGSFIAGMIAAVPDNGRGRAGVAPFGQLNLQKIADNNGALYFSYAVSAMADIAEGDLGVRVLSYSIAGSTYTASFRDAVAALQDADILLVTAAANCGVENCSDANNDDYPMYPGSFSYEHIVTVASSIQDDELNTYSHYGPWSVDVAAPGADLCSLGAYGDDDFYVSGGTSYATPIVAAIAALLLEAHPDLTTTELARVLRASVVKSDVWTDLVRSGGRVDALRALQTGVPRFDAPADAAVDGEGEITLAIDDAGADGEAWLVLSHDDALDFVSAWDQASDVAWQVQTWEEGETASLPDAGEFTVEGGRLTAIHGPVPSHGSATLALTTRGRQVGTWDVGARVSMVSDGADYLNAPYSDGTDDLSGFLAWTFQVRVTDTTTDTGSPDTGNPDTGSLDTGSPDTGSPDTGSPDTATPEEPGGCGCHAVPGAPGGWLVTLLLPLLAWRRRQR